MAPLENTGLNRGVAGENIQQHGAARLEWFTMRCGGIGDHRNAGYVIRMSGVVGGRGREASSYPDWHHNSGGAFFNHGDNNGKQLTSNNLGNLHALLV